MQRELIERAARGDQEAFASLASLHVDRSYALAYRILRDPDRAHDATQQALLGAWRDLSTLRDPDAFESWLYRLVVNACYIESRGHRRWLARLRVSVSEPFTPDVAAAVADRDLLEGAFSTLTPDQRALVVLHHHLGYSHAEVAATLGITEGAARSRLHVAVQRMRAALDADARTAATKERPA